MGGKGLLLVLVDPAPTLEEELNDWYDTEHLPERAVLPGFNTALRFTGLGDGPRYAAIYDLDDVDVLESEPYLACSGANFSPWTRRVTSRSHPTRMVAEKLSPGEAVTGACTRLQIVKFARTGRQEASRIDAGIGECYGEASGLLRHRIYAGIEPTDDFLLAIMEFSGSAIPPMDPTVFGAAGETIEMAASYRPYRG